MSVISVMLLVSTYYAKWITARRSWQAVGIVGNLTTTSSSMSVGPGNALKNA